MSRMYAKTVSDDELALFALRRREGRTYTEIAKETGRSPETISHYVRQMGMGPSSKIPACGVRKTTVREMWMNGVPTKHIGRSLSISVHTVLRIVKELSLPSREKQHGPKAGTMSPLLNRDHDAEFNGTITIPDSLPAERKAWYRDTFGSRVIVSPAVAGRIRGIEFAA